MNYELRVGDCVNLWKSPPARPRRAGVRTINQIMVSGHAAPYKEEDMLLLYSCGCKE